MSRLVDFAGSTRVVVAPRLAATALAQEAGAIPVQRWAVVADRGFADSGGLTSVLAEMPARSASVIGFVAEDPDLDDVEELVRAAVAAGASGVIAVGGGSGLCAGKAVAIRLANAGPLDKYAGKDRLPAPPVPCVAVPTTGGSGSEVSEVIILHQQGDGEHLMIRGRGYAPVVAILDGDLLATLPARPMVLAALDAYSHSLEALWSTGASSFTDAFATASAAAIREALPRALAGDSHGRQQLVEASTMANYACGNSELAMAHAIASTATVHLAHGYQTGVLLPHIADWCALVLRPLAAAEAAHIRPFYEQIGFDPHFAEGELDDNDLTAMVQGALANPLIDNDPRGAGADDVRRVLQCAGAGTKVAHR